MTLNRDFQPLGLYHSTRRWIVLSSPALGTLMRKLEGTNLRAVAALVALLALLVCLRVRGRHALLVRLTYTMATTGFAGMIFGLAAILAFQVVHGYVVSWIGLLVAGHMAGSACGAWRAGRPGATASGLARRLALNELAILLFAMLLPLLVQAAVGVANRPAGAVLVPGLFLTASFLAGGLTAHEFPLANALCSRAGADPSRAAGRLYALDLLGGWFGGMIGSVLLLPVLGLQGTCVLLGILKLAGFFLMVTARRPSGGAAATG